MTSPAASGARGPRLAVEVPRRNSTRPRACSAPPSPPESCLDIRLFYVRLCADGLAESPDGLALRFVGAGTGAAEARHGRVSLAEVAEEEEEEARPCVTLRRDRVHAESAEATYVSTDNIRTTGSLAFEVCHGEQLLLCGIISRLDSLDRQGFQTPDSVSDLIRAHWKMECCGAVASPRCTFLKKRSRFVHADSSPPLAMEVYVAGQFRGSAVVLTQTVQFTGGQKNGLPGGAVDGVSPGDESQRSSESMELGSLSDQIDEHRIYEELRKDGRTGMGRFYGCDSGGIMDSEDGGLTWFNAGVRVGVGIGLGMCLGIGIGVGLLIQTYQATAKKFKRHIS